MITLKNIKVKPIGGGVSDKLYAVKAYKEITGNSLLESKLFVENAIDLGLIDIEDNYLAKEIAIKVFDCEMVVEEENIDDFEVSSETKEALEWYENQLPFIQARIDLIVGFKCGNMIPFC